VGCNSTSLPITGPFRGLLPGHSCAWTLLELACRSLNSPLLALHLAFPFLPPASVCSIRTHTVALLHTRSSSSIGMSSPTSLYRMEEEEKYRSKTALVDNSPYNGQTESRGSFVADARFPYAARNHHSWGGQDYNRVDSSPYPESIPGTPLAPPTPSWVYSSRHSFNNHRSSSPVASSLYLPGTGNTHSPGGQSMSSLGSAPYRSERELAHLFPDTPSEFWDREWVRQGYIAKIHRRDDKDEW